MLRAEAHGLRGQKQHTQVLRQMGQAGRHHAIHQHRVHTHRQMGPMLLNGRHRQHGDGAGQVKLGEVARGQVGPET